MAAGGGGGCPGHLPPILLGLWLLLLTAIAATAGEASLSGRQGGAAEGGDCDLTGCWQLFQASQEALSIRDEYDEPRQLAPEEIRARCISYRTLYRCIQNMSRSCLGDLNYHSMHRGADNQMKTHNCSAQGTVFVPSDERPPRMCSYREDDSGDFRYCGMFGDPHLRTFGGTLQTCRAAGAWPLVDNKYFTIQVTNDHVGVIAGLATATTKVTVVVKTNECSDKHFVTYQASWEALPAAFDEGQNSFGLDEAVQLHEMVYNEHVEIYLRYIDTQIVIRRSPSGYLSVGVRVPAAVIEEGQDPGGADLQLCVGGCPGAERIDFREVLARTRVRARGGVRGSREGAPPQGLTRETAEARCREAGAVDAYYDSCVFDLMATGDVHFAEVARLAQEDLWRLHPAALTAASNRTSLSHTLPSSSSSSSAAVLSAHRLHYLHHTTFVLILSALTLCVNLLGLNNALTFNWASTLPVL